MDIICENIVKKRTSIPFTGEVMPRMTRDEFVRQRDIVRNPNLVAIRTDMGGKYVFKREGLDVLGMHGGITGQLPDGTQMEIPFGQIVSVCEP